MGDSSLSTAFEAKITGIGFALATRQEICKASISDCPISHASQLNNPFLGLPLETGKCESCGTGEPGQCEGHFGFIELPTPIYHPDHVGELKRMLSVLCLKCLKMKNRKSQVRNIGVMERVLATCCEETSQITINEAKTTDGACYLELKVPSKSCPPGFWNFLDKYGFRYGYTHTRPLLASETPRKCFERAAEKCHVDNLSSIVGSCAWGKHVSVGTGAPFEIFWDTRKAELSPEKEIDVYNFLHLVNSSYKPEDLATSCLGGEVEDLEDEFMGFDLSPERESGVDKPTFEDGVEFGVNGDDNDGFAKEAAKESENSWSAWGKKADEAPSSAAWGKKAEESPSSTAWGTNADEAPSSIAWGKKAEESPSSTAWGKKADEAPSSTGWGKKADEAPSGTAWGIKADEAPSSTAWGKKTDAASITTSWGKKTEEAPSSTAWGKKSDEAPSSTAWGKKTEEAPSSAAWGKKGDEVPSSTAWGKKADEAPITTAWGKKGDEAPITTAWGKKADEAPITTAWGKTAEEAPITAAWGKKADEAPTSAAWGKRADEAPASAAWDKKAEEVPSSAAWGKKVDSEQNDWGKNAKKSSGTGEAPNTSAWGNKTDSDGGGWSKKDETNKWGDRSSSREPRGSSDWAAPSVGKDWDEKEKTWGTTSNEKDWDKTNEQKSWENASTAKPDNQSSWGRDAAQTENDSSKATGWDTLASGGDSASKWGTKVAAQETHSKPSNTWGSSNDADKFDSQSPSAQEKYSPVGNWGSTQKQTNDSGWGSSQKQPNDSGWGSSQKQSNDTSSEKDAWAQRGRGRGWGRGRGRGGRSREGSQGRGPSDGGDWKNRRPRPVDDPNGPALLTVTRQRLDLFTVEEQDILTEIESIMKNVRRVMNPTGYNDGDPISADDQTFIIDNVFNYHPDKAGKTGAGIDYIMVSRHGEFQDSRCFYAVSVNGGKEDFSYRKCLENFIREKYPDKAEAFIPKYFRRQQPRPGWNRDRGGGRGEAGTPSWNRESSTPGPDEAGTPAWNKDEAGTPAWNKDQVATPATDEPETQTPAA
ncbi:hypothetical protein BUALT_Bualt01G0155600 [Buddleja alternifolia]|uniref:DNA-directed RNA polymerase n=1 Tax=Buddleja alternifolia TaxID=168488 RepID=A0AAV6YFZ0_9LAMI|nr:hypothetical protein BUALT_Bualt01G0155600 [Buddleja alternifolia]